MAVNKLQEFEIELSGYRKENHELKKNLGILLEKEENERVYRQELEKVFYSGTRTSNKKINRIKY